MPAETMLSFLKNCTPEGRMGFRVATQCAPVLKGVKISNLIKVKPGEGREIRTRLKGSGIVCLSLYRDQEMEVLFLYRYGQLEQHLRQPAVWGFLWKYGYEAWDVASVLERLRARYQQYAGGRSEFPHELGVLLEYPVEDVEGFIQNRGENCLLSRYWKVYSNRQQAERIFRLYDAAKEQALWEIVNGLPLYQVAVAVG
ncbi:MAG: DUF3793 family protein [Lachnospiraceae bacterium]|nr:DUF3793 family protein [Lachnospiraceae bacterium]